MNGPTLVIQTAFLGDVVLTTPLLTELAERHGPVDVVATPGAAPLLETHPAVHRVIRYDKRGRDRGWSGFFRLVRQLRSTGYVRAYLPHRSWRSGAMAWLARIPERVGFRDGARVLYTRSVPRATTGHAVERLLGLAGGTTPAPVTLGLTASDFAAADSWLEQRGIKAGFTALAPGSIWGTKRWPYYKELVTRLPGQAVVLGGPEDRALAEAVASGAPGRAYAAAGDVGIRISAALIARAGILVTNDSAPLHLATAAGTPIVAIFGPTVPAFGFGPGGSRAAVVEHPGLPCRPCSAHGPQVCPLGHHRCMMEIGIEDVARAIDRVLGA